MWPFFNQRYLSREQKKNIFEWVIAFLTFKLYYLNRNKVFRVHSSRTWSSRSYPLLSGNSPSQPCTAAAAPGQDSNPRTATRSTMAGLCAEPLQSCFPWYERHQLLQRICVTKMILLTAILFAPRKNRTSREVACPYRGRKTVKCAVNWVRWFQEKKSISFNWRTFKKAVILLHWLAILQIDS